MLIEKQEQEKSNYQIKSRQYNKQHRPVIISHIKHNFRHLKPRNISNPHTCLKYTYHSASYSLGKPITDSLHKRWMHKRLYRPKHKKDSPIRPPFFNTITPQPIYDHKNPSLPKETERQYILSSKVVKDLST